MILFLTSSPCLDNVETLNPANDFTQELQEALPSPCSTLVVCSDPDTEAMTDFFAAGMEAAFAKLGIELSPLQTLDGRNAQDAPELVAGADFIIFCGGHVPTQNAFFRSIGLRELLEDWDGVVMGVSAGSMNCADAVYAHPEEPGEAVDPDYERWLPGLGLTDVNILPHYQEIHDHVLDGLRIFEDIAYPDSFGNAFLVLVDGSYLLCAEDFREVCGEAYLIREGEMERICDLGERCPL